MSKQDDQFLPEQVDEQIEILAHQENPTLPEAHLVSDLHQIYEEEYKIAERVWARLNSHIMQNIRERPGHKDQALHISVKEAQSMKTQETQQPSRKKRRYRLEIVAAVLVSVALVGSLLLLLHSQQLSPASKGTATATTQPLNRPTATPTPPSTVIPSPKRTPEPTPTLSPTRPPQPPTSVVLRLSAPGIAPTTKGAITIPAGTKVTLTVIPDHSLLPFQILTMGIYATDPYGFSELQYCTYPDTDTCTYTIAYSSAERTDYTKGKHTFVAFLGNIGGAILKNSNSITITWS